MHSLNPAPAGPHPWDPDFPTDMATWPTADFDAYVSQWYGWIVTFEAAHGPHSFAVRDAFAIAHADAIAEQATRDARADVDAIAITFVRAVRSGAASVVTGGIALRLFGAIDILAARSGDTVAAELSRTIRRADITLTDLAIADGMLAAAARVADAIAIPVSA